MASFVTQLIDTVEASQAVCTQWLGDTAHLTTDIATALVTQSGIRILSVDLEGRSLSATGDVDIVTILDSVTGVCYLFDVTTLRKAVFDEGLLGAVLSHAGIIKVFFDIRMDSAALFHQFDVTLKGAVDLQPLAMKRFCPQGQYLLGLFKTMAKLNIGNAEDEKIKAAGKALFAPENGGSYDIWGSRPLPMQLRSYCATDVKHFPKMASQLIGKNKESVVFAMKVTQSRIAYQEAEKRGKGSAERDF
jgi:ribonuclease D